MSATTSTRPALGTMIAESVRIVAPASETRAPDGNQGSVLFDDFGVALDRGRAVLARAAASRFRYPVRAETPFRVKVFVRGFVSSGPGGRAAIWIVGPGFTRELVFGDDETQSDEDFTEELVGGPIAPGPRGHTRCDFAVFLFAERAGSTVVRLDVDSVDVAVEPA